MFNSPILDLVIALSFIYFVFSLIVSAIHEFIFSVLKRKRADFLKHSIYNLFFDSSWKSLIPSIEKSPHLQALINKKGFFPSYIPSKNFAMFLMDQMRDQDKLLDMARIEHVLTTNDSGSKIEGEVKKMLLSLYERSAGDIQKFQLQIEQFFDNAMERAAGVYKKSVHRWMLFFALMITILTNIDTLHISKTLWGDKKELASIATNIGQHIGESTNGNFVFSVKDGDSTEEVVFSIIHRDSVINRIERDTSTGTDITIPQLMRKSTQAVSYMQNEGMPIGWTKNEIDNAKLCNVKSIALFAFEKILGIIITTMALSLGAPFWFDLLNKFVNLRAAGKKPATEESKK